MRRLAWPSATLTLLALAVLGAYLAGQPTGSEASPETVVGVDADPYQTPANTAITLGTTEPCVAVASPNTFEVDIFIDDVTNLMGWEVYLHYNDQMLDVVDVTIDGWFLGNPTFEEWDDSISGSLWATAWEMGLSKSGSGTLARVFLQAIGSGTSPLNLEVLTLADSEALPISHTVFDAKVSVDGACDADGDGVSDDVDNCPVVPNGPQEEMENKWWLGNQTDADGDTIGDACDTSDGDGEEDGSAFGSCSDGADNGGDTLVDGDDPDCRAYTDGTELYIGTDYLDACSDNLNHPAWPLDQNNDTLITTSDVVVYRGMLFTAITGPTDPNSRLDIAPDALITTDDVVPYKGRLFHDCDLL